MTLYSTGVRIQHPLRYEGSHVDKSGENSGVYVCHPRCKVKRGHVNPRYSPSIITFIFLGCNCIVCTYWNRPRVAAAVPSFRTTTVCGVKCHTNMNLLILVTLQVGTAVLYKSIQPRFCCRSRRPFIPVSDGCRVSSDLLYIRSRCGAGPTAKLPAGRTETKGATFPVHPYAKKHRSTNTLWKL